LQLFNATLLGTSRYAPLATLLRSVTTRSVLLAQTIFKLEPETPNMLQHFAVGWPKARSMLCPTMLRWHVAIVWPGLYIYTLTFSLGYKKEYSLSSGDLAKMKKKTLFNLKQHSKVNYSKENNNMRSSFLHSWSSSYNSSQSRSCKGKIIFFK